MKRRIIFLVLILFCLNSCYFIKQAYYDEKMSSEMRGKKTLNFIDNKENRIFDEIIRKDLKKIEYNDMTIQIPK